MSSLVPVIDLGRVVDGNAPSDVLDAIRSAGENVGVIQVVNHGVPLSLILEHDRRTTELLAKSRDEKADLASPTGHPYRGWRQWPDDFGRLELERYMVARFDNADEAIAAGIDPEIARVEYEHENVWPHDDPNYRDLVQTYRAEIIALAERVLELFAQALGVPADSFHSVGPDTTKVTFNKYPTWTWPDDATDEDKLLLLEHADGNAITILYQEGDYAGLQVQQPDGSWEAVPIIEGALQVFFGGLISVWTNDRWVPGRHRVVSGGSAVRHSTAIFYSPGFDTVIAPIPSLLAPGEEPSYEPNTIYGRSKDFVDDYLRVFARPDQLEAYQSRTKFVADVREEESTRGGCALIPMSLAERPVADRTTHSGDEPETTQPKRLAAIAAELGQGAASALVPAGTTRRWTYAIETDIYEAVVIAWPSGTGLRMHDHDGSLAAIYVVNGRLRERYIAANGQVRVRWLEAGQTTNLSADHVHEVINLHDHEVVSVHVYSPPLGDDSFRADKEIDINRTCL